MDGLSLLEDEAGLGLNLSLTPRKRRKRKLDEFTPEVEQSALQTLGGKALSGVAAVGNLLDIPGSMARDVLGGENPFDQLLSPLSDQNRLSGRDLLRKHGLIGRSDTWGNFAGGLAAEILLDPTTYLTLGSSAALTGAGKVARSAGLLDDAVKATGAIGRRSALLKGTLDDLLRHGGDEALEKATKAAGGEAALEALRSERLASLAHVGVPFTKLGFNVGTGKAAMRLAEGMDVVASAAKKTLPVRAVRALFDPQVMGELGVAEQQLAEHTYGLRKEAERLARKEHREALADIVEANKAFTEVYGERVNAFGKAESLGEQKAVLDTFQKIVGLSAELGGDVDQAFKVILGNAPPPSPELAGKIKAIGDKLQKTMKDVHGSIIDKGGKTSFIADIQADEGVAAFEHMPRYVDPKVAKENTLLKSSKVLTTKHGSMLARDEAIRTIPKEIVNQILQDETLRGANATDELLAKYGNRLSDAFEGGREGHAQALKDWIARHRQSALFTMPTSDEFFRYMSGANAVDKTYDAIHDLVRRNMTDPSPTNIAIHTAYKNAGLDADKALHYLGKLTGLSETELLGKGIPAELANAMAGVHKVTSQPEWAKFIGESIDKFNNWFKSEVTIPFPSFWTRNFTSGQYMNLVSGLIENPQDMAAYSKQVFRVKDMVQKGLPQDLMDELIIEGVVDPRVVSEGVETLGFGFSPTGPKSPFDLKGTFGEAKQNVLDNPLFSDKIPGAKAVRTGWATVKGTGERASSVVEFANRVPLYLYLREKGWDAAAAANKVRELQIDYSALSPFEKNVMRRVAPFYSFQRRIAPVILSTLASRPGGALAQTIRASNDARGDDSLSLPEYVANTLSIPLGSKPDGSLSYLTGFGLPHEQPLAFFEGGAQGAIREALSQTTPLVKAPIEWASGQSFFQRGPGGAGRPLDEMDPLIGRFLSNAGETAGLLPEGSQAVELPSGLEFLAANSPFSRLISTGRKAVDPRKTAGDKAINLLTGVNQTDVSPRTQDKVLREKATELMQEMGAAAFERVFFTEAEKARMTPEERQQAEALELLQAALADRAKKRKK